MWTPKAPLPPCHPCDPCRLRAAQPVAWGAAAGLPELCGPLCARSWHLRPPPSLTRRSMLGEQAAEPDRMCQSSSLAPLRQSQARRRLVMRSPASLPRVPTSTSLPTVPQPLAARLRPRMAVRRFRFALTQNQGTAEWRYRRALAAAASSGRLQRHRLASPAWSVRGCGGDWRSPGSWRGCGGDWTSGWGEEE